jgi:hypothetical protein
MKSLNDSLPASIFKVMSFPTSVGSIGSIYFFTVTFSTKKTD